MELEREAVRVRKDRVVDEFDGPTEWERLDPTLVDC